MGLSYVAVTPGGANRANQLYINLPFHYVLHINMQSCMPSKRDSRPTSQPMLVTHDIAHVLETLPPLSLRKFISTSAR
jgi:hypothetical protein